MTVRRSPPIAGFALVIGVALALAVRAPLATTVLGLLAFGLLHNALELRYVAGRFADLLAGRFLLLLIVLISGIAACRLAALVVGQPARYAEILLGYAVLAVGARDHPKVAPAIVLAATASVTFPAYHFVVLAHLHNLVPLVFLWDWARRLPANARRRFRALQVGWVVAVPAVLLAGLADRWITGTGADTVAAFAGPPSKIIAGSAPPAAWDTQWGIRLLVVFAFLQTMHYAIWVGFMPRYAPDAARAFERRVPWLAGWRVWALGLSAGAVLAVLVAVDYASGRTLYAAVASYHAYVEFPVLLALLAGPMSDRDPTKGVASEPCTSRLAGS